MLQRRVVVLLTVSLAVLLDQACAAPLKTPTGRAGFCENKMASEIAAMDKQAKGYDVIFYGDSIFETLRGTDKCRPCDKVQTYRSSCAGVPAIFQRVFGRYRPGVMALAMDQSANLLWRLQNGAVPKKNQAKVSVLLIGTNDLTNCAWGATIQSVKEQVLAKEEAGIVSRITQAVKLLQRGMPKTKVLVVGLLPRGTGTGKGVLNQYNDFSWPSHYSKSIASINNKLKAYAAQNRGKVSFVDCGKLFVKGNLLDARLMADAIHPTAAGWNKLAACLLPQIKALAG